MKNKFGVNYHKYEITLINGATKIVDVGYEEDWGDIQQMWKDTGFGNMVECVGWGNDNDGHLEIVKVIDIEDFDKDISPIEWAHNHVWKYADNYSS